MLQNEILVLLSKNMRVILPDLGAFIVKPGNDGLLFNEFLKFNDGLLIDHIAESKGIDKIAASREVKKFTNHIIRSLAKEKTCDLNPLGTLYIDENEKIQLKSAQNIQSILSENDIEVNYQPINETRQKEESYIPTVSVIIPKDSITEATTKEKTPMSHVSSKNENGRDSSEIDYDYYEKKSKGKIILIVLALLAIAGVTYFVFIKNPHFFSKEETVASVPDTSDAVKAVPIPEPVTQPEPAVENSSKSSAGNKYHIIAGAFVVEKNADAFMQELQKKGYSPQVVLKRNQYNFISIFSYPTFKEANSKYKSLESSGMPIWIMKHNM